MQPKNLGWKFAFVGLLVALSLYSLWANGLREGIDLKGGHILQFKVDLGEGASSGVVREVISTLKERVDPRGVGDLTWRPVGDDRLEVRMPLGTERSRQAKEAFDNAMKRLEGGNILRSQLRKVESLAGQERSKTIDDLSAGNPARAEMLRKAGEAYDAHQAAQETFERLRREGAPEEQLNAARARRLRAQSASLEASQAVLEANVNVRLLGELLELYVSRREKEQLSQKQVDQRTKELNDRLKELRLRHPDRTGQIDAVAKAHQDWREKRTGLDDPEDLKRLIAKAGVLDFRIAPVLPVRGRQGEPALTEQQYLTYTRQLQEQGPLAARARAELQWFPIRKGTEKLSPDMVVGRYAGRKYVLLYNKPGFTMLQQTGEAAKRSWSLTATPGSDDMGRPAVHFELDARGARQMGLLTGGHRGHYMAILLDDEVYSAPVIRATIYERGIIEGTFTQDEVKEMCRILNAGALAARVNPDPVSERTIGASIGQDNKNKGKNAAYWGLIGVAVFMMVYYLSAGAIADVALLLNLVLVLGAMSFIDAVFTLPGIAGVILTIGMAVDANVLIFERLREEQVKTQSMRMAIRNAYSSAASAILDSNATTLITCLILGWVGTEEVRGFAITLGLGVMFSLFTALIVTRWVFQLLAEMGLLKARLHMLAFIGTPNVNWMGKRRLFWLISIVVAAGGIVSVVGQGRDLLGLEFSAGSQAVFSFKEGLAIPGPDGNEVLPQRALVEQAIRNQARELGRGGAGANPGPGSAPADTAPASAPAAAAGGLRAEELRRLAETAKVETILQPDKERAWLDRFGAGSDGAITRAAFAARKYSLRVFDELDGNRDGKLVPAELKQLPSWSYQVSTTVADLELLREVIRGAFGEYLAQSPRVQFELQKTGPVPGLDLTLDRSDAGKTPITEELVESKLSPTSREAFRDFVGGVMYVVRDLRPALTEAALLERIRNMRSKPDFAGFGYNPTAVVGLEAAGAEEGFRSFAVLVYDSSAEYTAQPERWKESADKELTLLTAALERRSSLESLQEFDAAIAERAAQLAVVAFVLSWAAIIVYLWLRFGQARWGLAAVVCLVHDVVIAVGLVGAGAFLARTVLGRWLLVEAFKIDMAVVAAFLTIIGYSVNDTIVVFDRIRENRGRLTTVDEKTINRSINQTLSRTLLTTTTTLIAVVVMYVGGGPGIHAFTYALLIGILFGTYSSIAIASPLLLGFKQAVVGRVAGPSAKGGK